MKAYEKRMSEDECEETMAETKAASRIGVSDEDLQREMISEEALFLIMAEVFAVFEHRRGGDGAHQRMGT